MADVAKLRKEFKDLISRLTDEDWEKWHDGLDERIEKQKQEMLAEAGRKTFESQLPAFNSVNLNAQLGTGASMQFHINGVKIKIIRKQAFAFDVKFVDKVEIKPLSVREVVERSGYLIGHFKKGYVDNTKIYSGAHESQLFAY